MADRIDPTLAVAPVRRRPAPALYQCGGYYRGAGWASHKRAGCHSPSAATKPKPRSIDELRAQGLWPFRNLKE